MIEAQGPFVQNKHWISTALFVESFDLSLPVIKEQVFDLRERVGGCHGEVYEAEVIRLIYLLRILIGKKHLKRKLKYTRKV